MLRKQPEKPIPKLFGLRPRRQQPKTWDRIKRRIERYFAQMSPAKHVAMSVDRVTNAFRVELSGIFATVLLAKKTLDATRLVETPFPDKLFDTAVPPDEAGRAELDAYARALENFYEQLLEEETPLSYATAQGIAIWIASTYGLAHPELTAEVQRMWAHLVKGEEGVGEALEMLIRRKPSDMDREYFSYRPAALVVPK